LFGAEQVGLLHGRLKPAQKAKVMEQFRKGEFGVLASTTVIEVGVDIPNATVMVIENSERFGLAQLHQLRGRVGRGTQKSYCVLVPGDTAPPESIERIRLLERTENGFELAEADFKLRGPGNILGTEQSGLPPFALAELGGDPTPLRDARELAATLLKADPELKKHPELARVVARFEHVEKAESLD
jgi:ATP-dependent DNA helicase RecG